MVPMFIQPALAPVLEQFEVKNATDFILLMPRDMEFDNVVMPMQILALSIVSK